VLEAAARRAKRFIGFDMAAAAQQTGSAISAVMFGALAGSEALPFPREAFVKAIMSGDKSPRVNLAGFEAGFEGSRNKQRADTPPDVRTPAATTSAGRELEERIAAELPPVSHHMAIEGVRRLMDYQDAAYANFYLNRLAQVHGLDDGRNDWALTRETVGGRLHRSPIANRLLAGFFNKGRFIETTGLAGFVMLSLIASARRWRRSTLRYAEEQARIEAWLDVVCNAAATDLDAAVELIRCQRMIKGYGETFERGIENFDRAIATYRQLTGSPNAAAVLRKLREATLASTSH
jgi:indolepyruvate ferredoxin oxidoreductase, beta subunit